MSVPTRIETVRLQSFRDSGITVDIKRDDLIHPFIIGNKLRKSLQYFEQCQQSAYSSVLTFGGRFSNHLLAVAQTGQQLGIATAGIVRGSDVLGTSVVLDECRHRGMRILPVQSEHYYPLQRLSTEELVARFGLDTLPYRIPEGGTSALALEGVGRIIDEITDLGLYRYIVCAVGTGGTAAGLVWALAQRAERQLPKVLAIAAARGYTSLPEQGQLALRSKVGEAAAESMLAAHLAFDGSAPWGRFGKPSDRVMVKMRALQDQLSMPLDYVYTGKVLLQLEQLAQSGRFARGCRLLFLHTGGYQTAPV